MSASRSQPSSTHLSQPPPGICSLLSLTRFCCAGLEGKLKALAAKRKMEDLTIGPVLTWTTDAMLGHVYKLLKLEGGPCIMAQPLLDDCASMHALPARGALHADLQQESSTGVKS